MASTRMPKDKSYCPLTAHLAQTGQLLGVVNREGNVHDSHRALETLAFVVDEIREHLAPATSKPASTEPFSDGIWSSI